MQVSTEHELHKLQKKSNNRVRKRNKNEFRKTVQRQLSNNGCNGTRKRASRDGRHNLAYI
jgi:hypothetical protein